MPEDESRKDTESVGQDDGRAALIVNTRSRTGEKVFFKALDLLQEMDVPARGHYAIRDPARLPETVREVMDDGYGVLILGGGDGSVSSVVDFLAHSDATLGLLPLGTANDFARTLDIPSDVEAACDTIANGKVVDVDLGLAGDNYYVNVASVGLGVEATRALTPWAKRNTGPLAYPVAAIRAFLRHEPFSARLVFPDGDHEPVEYERLLQVAVGNGRFYGGGMVVAPDSGIDDRTLDVYAITSAGTATSSGWPATSRAVTLSATRASASTAPPACAWRRTPSCRSTSTASSSPGPPRSSPWPTTP